MGSDESHCNVSLIVRDKITKHCPQNTTVEEKGEPKRIRNEVPLLTSLTPSRWAKPAQRVTCNRFGPFKGPSSHSGVPGEIKRSRDLRGGRWSWTLTFAQKRSWVGRWSWAEQVGRLLLRVVQVVRQQRCNGHCLSDSVQRSSWKSNCAVHKSLGNGEGTPP